MSDTSVLESFNALQSTAASLTDLMQWLRDHPQVLVGAAHQLQGSTVDMTLTYQSNKMIHNAYKYDALEVSVRACVISPPVSNPVLHQLAPDYAADTVTHFDQTFSFELPLGTWPVAVAMVAANFVERRHEYANDVRMGQLGQTLGTHLAKHFPGFTMEKLGDLHAAGLLAQHDDGRLDLRAIGVLLFQSRTQQSAPALPLDLATP